MSAQRAVDRGEPVLEEKAPPSEREDVVMTDKRCRGHDNDFRHFEGQLEGLEDRFDVGYKFEVEDPLGNLSGPYLVLYFSFAPFDRPVSSKERARYELNRDHWETSHAPTKADRGRLLEESLPELANEIRKWSEAHPNP